MATSKLAVLEARIASLENELKLLKDSLRSGQSATTERRDWIDDIWGSFANNPDYDKAMELGRKYRESLRPKPAKKRSVKSRKKKSSVKRRSTIASKR